MRTIWAIAAFATLLGSACVAMAGQRTPTESRNIAMVEEYTVIVLGGTDVASGSVPSPVPPPGYNITLDTPGVSVTESLNVIVMTSHQGYLTARVTGFDTPGLTVTTLTAPVPYTRRFQYIPIPVTAVATLAVPADRFTGTVTITAIGTSYLPLPRDPYHPRDGGPTLTSMRR